MSDPEKSCQSLIATIVLTYRTNSAKWGWILEDETNVWSQGQTLEAETKNFGLKASLRPNFSPQNWGQNFRLEARMALISLCKDILCILHRKWICSVQKHYSTFEYLDIHVAHLASFYDYDTFWLIPLKVFQDPWNKRKWTRFLAGCGKMRVTCSWHKSSVVLFVGISWWISKGWRQWIICDQCFYFTFSALTLLVTYS